MVKSESTKDAVRINQKEVEARGLTVHLLQLALIGDRS
jgi:hypothetical protein